MILLVSQKTVETIGQVMVRAGVAILTVPDPLPVVDEVVGVVLVVGGTATLAYARYGMEPEIPTVAITPGGLQTVPIKDITKSPGVKTSASSFDNRIAYASGTQNLVKDKSWLRYYAANR